MKTTQYFDFVRLRPDRQAIRDEWILEVIKRPIRKIIQEDGRIRLWGRISTAEDKVLRVVLLPDAETVHNAFFDRSFKGA